MTTITIKNGQKLKKTHFENLVDLQNYLISMYLKNDVELTDEHKSILDSRINEVNENPENYLTIDELKASIVRKNV
ncbi:MAG TPA: hypothetical protein EYG80_05215 [Flavobacteriaceae bacterium]|nr:hypothetical protein [Flavobacteriaceae bacterium]